MEEDVERHHMARDVLEVELQALRERLQLVESISEEFDLRNSSREPSEYQLSRCAGLSSLSHIIFVSCLFFLSKLLDVVHDYITDNCMEDMWNFKSFITK